MGVGLSQFPSQFLTEYIVKKNALGKIQSKYPRPAGSLGKKHGLMKEQNPWQAKYYIFYAIFEVSKAQ